MWVIDEKAIIDFNFVCLIPIVEPIRAFKVGISRIILWCGLIVNTIIDKGASFCHVDRIVHDNQEIDDITEGNHMWHGAIPNLMSIDIVSIVIRSDLFVSIIWSHSDDDAIKKIIDPIACAKKYLIIASDSWNLLDDFISGIKDSILISRAVQVNSKLFLEIAIIDLHIIIIYRR
jgi:hypothetical protein